MTVQNPVVAKLWRLGLAQLVPGFVAGADRFWQRCGYVFRSPDGVMLRYQAFLLTNYANLLKMKRSVATQLNRSEVDQWNTVVSSQRLEHVGDAMLDLAVSSYMYRTFPTAAEGELTKLRESIVRNDRLAYVGVESLAVHEVLAEIPASSAVHPSARSGPSVGRQFDPSVPDTVEAIVGAVFLDGGFEAAASFVRRWIIEPQTQHSPHKSLYDALMGNAFDPIVELQARTLAASKSLPIYEVLERKVEPTQSTEFIVSVSVGGTCVGQGVGCNIMAARRNAAAAALAQFERADPAENAGLN